jgi:hypothetical protein
MLKAEQIQSNLEQFYSNIEQYIAEPRRSQLLALYNKQEEILALAPASSKASFHNSFPGGYVDHINRVVAAALAVSTVWMEFGADTDTFTREELVFSAINHDLGKLGLDGKPRYIPNDSEWHVKNQGANYKPNAELPFLPVQDNSLFILQSAGIQLSVNEYIAIKIHDGLYDDGNKAYLISGQNESKLRSSLALILHQADMLASRVEWEKEWLGKVGVAKPKEIKPTTPAQFKQNAEAKKLHNIGSKGNTDLLNALKGL